jgi:hypothetical protein
MTPAKFLLMMHQSLLLFRIQHAKLPHFLFAILDIRLIVYCEVREVVAVLELGERAFATQAPGEVVVVGDETHVVGVDYAEGGEAVADYGEEGDEHVVDYVYDVVFAAADVDPAD